jgi:hypothetical protein
MSLASIVRNAVALVNKQTLSLQETVQFIPWVGQSDEGAPAYGTPLLMTALVEKKEGTLTLANGVMINTKAHVTFIQPISPTGAAGRIEPIDNRDVIILADGTTGPIIGILGLDDPSTSYPYMMEVDLGK